ncbi:hypothetical protein [Fibrobacter intestinalis]|uniref:Uncharacterized protein n=1 Tax=Fibrobacter intestinalis TaxID=28122 RepID=A0A1T4RBI5_9BACT|nr:MULTISPECIES: hypothetical protein [Fibrobacter]PBC73868.1 hypothetical protein BGW94_1493 [Fibrobacter sp. NR9]SKA13394.1 hypothetical protein SAMN02745108_02641 [Fibrobacter intestinalis]
MNTNAIKLGYSVKWNVLEKFYKTIENGSEKLEKLKVGYEKYDELSEARVNYDFLWERWIKINHEFEWTDQKVEKMIRLDKRIRELEYEMYLRFLETKKGLDSLIAQGSGYLREYQVEAKIEYDPWLGREDECSEIEPEKTEAEKEEDWISGLLHCYADWENIRNYTFGDGDEPKDPHGSDRFIFEAWGTWLNYDYFVENGMTIFLCYLIEETQWSLFSFEDVLKLDPKCFYVSYKILY